MGACFMAFTPVNRVHVSYGTVHKYRTYLLRMLDPELAEYYDSSLHKPYDFENDCEGWNDFLKKLSGHDDNDVWCGVRFFVNHSDCDGFFEEEECRCIALALKALLEQDFMVDNIYRENIEQLSEVFEAAAEDGHVEIA